MRNRNILFVAILILIAQGAVAQIKKDTVYYLLDSLNQSGAKTLFEKQVEGNILAYVLKCNCYPRDKDPVFVSRINDPEVNQFISTDELKKIKTISISRLIKLISKYSRERIDKYSFVFIEREGDKLKKIKVVLMPPRKASQDAILY